MDIRKQILADCKEIFDSELALIRKYDDLTKAVMPKGRPEAMLIAEFDSNTRSLNKIRKGKNSGEIVKAWRYRNGVLRAVKLSKEPERSSTGDEFYKEAYARFAFSEEKRVVYLNVFYAPRYVKGWRYPIVEDEKGLKLGESCLKWLY